MNKYQTMIDNFFKVDITIENILCVLILSTLYGYNILMKNENTWIMKCMCGYDVNSSLQFA